MLSRETSMNINSRFYGIDPTLQYKPNHNTHRIIEVPNSCVCFCCEKKLLEVKITDDL